MKPLKIKIENIGLKTTTGRSILRMYPDQNTPILDLFVRESIQNSLDATNNQENYVKVEFGTGDFNTADFCNSLEGVAENLRRRFPEEKNSYLSVRDYNTKGLTGPITIDDVTNYEFGNLIKLVYDIGKPQENLGAGGSWGVGKSIYFRLGVGIVFYYSRIYDETNETYQSRLAVSLIENEQDKEHILLSNATDQYTGCAWWGELTDEGRPIPITNEERIEELLNIFNIAPYTEEETGTLIIIPFINEDMLLGNNRTYHIETEDGVQETMRPAWATSIESYLKMTAQRWYFPRLNNDKYKYGNHLRLFINGQRICKDDMLPLFRIGQILYNSASEAGKVVQDDDYPNLEINIENIRLNRVFEDTNNSAGCLASARVSKEILEMLPPENNYPPYYYLDLEEEDPEVHKPIFTFCRKPGMVVSYKDEDNKWLHGVPYTCDDTYILSIFVLNSETRLRDVDDTLEEYIRNSEMANHNRWEDYVFRNKNRDIIQNIKKNTARKLAAMYNEKEAESNITKIDSGLGRLMADLILPPEGFGKKPAQPKKKPGAQNLSFSKHRDYGYAMVPDSSIYSPNGLDIDYKVKAQKTVDKFNLCVFINSETGAIHAKAWEDNGLDLPFEIAKAIIHIEDIDGTNNEKVYEFSASASILTDKLLTCDWRRTNQGKRYGLTVRLDQEHKFTIRVTLSLSISGMNLEPIIKPE